MDRSLFQGRREHSCTKTGSTHYRPMLVVGKNKSPLFKTLPATFLLIGSEHFASRRGTHLDLSRHSLNPLKGMNYKKAVEFIEILNAAYPAGDATLTKETAHFQILKALMSKPQRLSSLVPDTTETRSAYQKIERLLLSPILYPFLTAPTNIPLKGVLYADLSNIPYFDAFIIANLLISNYQGHIIVPDYARYACPFHPLERMSVGVNFLDEVSFRNKLLLVKDKIGSQCVPEDAKVLAEFSGVIPGTNAFTDFIHNAVS